MTPTLAHDGFCILPAVLLADELAGARERLDAVYSRQERETGRETLEKIGDLDTARLPLAYDPYFLRLASHPSILTLARETLGRYIVLQTQNGIINRPDARHAQSAWHRDLPHQEWTSSRPLGLSVLVCLDPFTPETGATEVLPQSHRWDRLPPAPEAEGLACPVVAESGSAIVFDAMLYHRAGRNRSAKVRRGINHVYTIPLIRQAIDLPRALGGAGSEDPALAELLGYTSQSADSVAAWRAARARRMEPSPR